MENRRYGIVTGASSGIGWELAKCCVMNGFDLLIASDEPRISAAAQELAIGGAKVQSLEVDLSTSEGIQRLYSATQGRPVDALLANAGRGLGHAFLDQDFKDILKVIKTNVVGTLDLIHKVGRDMRTRRQGRILITGSIAGVMPGTYQAVYNGTKAMLDSFSYALGAELKDSGVTVTCLMPGETESDFFERADLMDTKYATKKKMPADQVAKMGFDAMMKGEPEVITGWANKLKVAISHILPNTTLAKEHAKMAGPGTAERK
jgi:uncharacterized protein